MSQENRILIRNAPTLTPRLIALPDYESEKAKNSNRQLFDREGASTYRRQSGKSNPLIKIGTSILPRNNIMSLEIRQDSFIPEIQLMFTDYEFAFTSRTYPVSDIIVSIFIQSNVKELKSFSGDFIITNISSIPIPGSNNIMYSVSGELHIPKLYSSYSKSYKNMSSLAVLEQVANELNLGFADNQPEGTNDIMTWLMPNISYREFINQVIKFAYKNDNSFFDCFIDRYYNLNFINVEKQFAKDTEIDTGYIARDQSNLNMNRVLPNDEFDSVEVPIILTNHPNIKGNEFYIIDFNLISNHGEILKKYAIRSYLYWYEHGSASPSVENEPTKKLESPPFRMQYVEPLISTITNDGKLPQTTSLNEYATNDETSPIVNDRDWAGLDYGNAHPSYKFAELLNFKNKIEIEKNLLEITLSGFSLNIIRGSRVRVEMFLNRLSALNSNVLAEDYDPESEPVLNDIEDNTSERNSALNNLVEDKVLSDFYYVKEITYTYKDGKFMTHLKLSRRHWILPLPKNEIYV